MKKTIDDIYGLCDSRYALVNIVAEKAREIAEEAERRHESLTVKPVNIVLDNLISGKSTIARPNAPANIYRDDSFEVNIAVDNRIGDEE